MELKKVIIYTDGACLGNPGPGGYAAILEYDKRKKEISGGYKSTTNNRMEIMAAIAGLEAITSLAGKVHFTCCFSTALHVLLIADFKIISTVRVLSALIRRFLYFIEDNPFKEQVSSYSPDGILLNLKKPGQ